MGGVKGRRFVMHQVEPQQMFSRVHTFDAMDEVEAFARRKRKALTVFKVIDIQWEQKPQYIGSRVT